MFRVGVGAVVRNAAGEVLLVRTEAGERDRGVRGGASHEQPQTRLHHVVHAAHASAA
jgi:hypothetical protein